MTSKPDSVSTLGYHWTDRTGRPLEPQVHWDATGTTLADASTQWCSSGDPVLICIIRTHWKTSGKPLEDHWKHTGISPVAFQCTLGSKFQAHWIATGLPLEDLWLRVRVSWLFVNWDIENNSRNISIKIQSLSFEKTCFKIAFAKFWPIFTLGYSLMNKQMQIDTKMYTETKREKTTKIK